MIELSQDEHGVLLPVKVVPGASRTRLMGELDGRLKIAVASPPAGGQANQTLITFLAKQLGVRKGSIEIAAGAGSPIKTVRLRDVDPGEVCRRLALR